MKNSCFGLLRRISRLASVAVAIIGLPASHAKSPETEVISSADSGRLLITRSFTLGAVPVLVKIDGIQVAALSYNRRYEGPIAPGSHLLRLIQIPNTVSSRSEATHLVVRKGQTYHLTATRLGHEVMLR